MTGLYLGPEMSDNAPPIVKEGIARRALVWTAGGCPCGATVPVLNRAQRRAAGRGGVVHVTIQHNDGCAAIAPATVAWLDGAR
jgi:hypothetical protein